MLFFSSLFTISYLDGGGHDGSRAVVSDGTMGKVFAIQNILVGPEEFPELFFRHLNRHFFIFLPGSDFSELRTNLSRRQM
jgi:hypothetical protein